MYLSLLLIMLPLLSLAYCFLQPLQALDFISGLRQRWRDYLEKKYGRMAYEDIAKRFRQAALQQGATLEQIEAFLQEQKDQIIARRGYELVQELFEKKRG